MKFRILGLSASLRNARRGKGNARMLEELQAIDSKPELVEYLKQQANIHLENFKEAGRNDKLPFDELYANLKKLKGDRGMSNSRSRSPPRSGPRRASVPRSITLAGRALSRHRQAASPRGLERDAPRGGRDHHVDARLPAGDLEASVAHRSSS